MKKNYKQYKDNIPELIKLCDADCDYNEWFKLISALYKEGEKVGDQDKY